ncbi:hypothetical protein NDU88_005754 [Pleurodeles waltl]|uniref:Uncharacterized protein n=1 Tax=Pleurodeles waltl TaxID=8319 RepID=A0AAV7QFZ3_PLEWA|nr:hypothetical protein NDU88_005754 [Pleurodeles waltl]
MCFSKKVQLKTLDNVTKNDDKYLQSIVSLEPSDKVTVDIPSYCSENVLIASEKNSQNTQPRFPDKIPIEEAFNFFECEDVSYNVVFRDDRVNYHTSNVLKGIGADVNHSSSAYHPEVFSPQNTKQWNEPGSSTNAAFEDVPFGAVPSSTGFLSKTPSSSSREDGIVANHTTLMGSPVLMNATSSMTSNSNKCPRTLNNMSSCTLPEDITSCDYEDPAILYVLSSMDYFYNVSTYGVVFQEFETHDGGHNEQALGNSSRLEKGLDTIVNDSQWTPEKNNYKTAPCANKRKCEISDEHLPPRKHRAGDSSILEAVKEFCISSMSPAMKKQLGFGDQ